MTTTFASLGLAEPLLRAVSDEGYETPTPIQAQAIPQVIAGGDLLAAAQTGTGKTAGFTLPILHRLHEKHARPGKPGQPRVLILTPTRELAAQVEESVKTYGRHLKFTTTLVFGGVGIVPQIQRLKRPIDILVATPGRLLDHVSQRTVDLSAVETLVLDEADRMLDMGFIRDIRKVLALLPEGRQNLLFSATYSDDIKSLAAGLLKDPVLVEVARKNPASELVAQAVHMVDKDKKKDLLAYLIREENWTQALVFTRTKHGANKLAEQLTKSGIMADAIHGNKSQSARTRALADFKGGQLRILVATDIAARGLDIDLLPQVVNFELPQVPEDYVHRIGRTGRAGSEGKAVSLVCGEEMKLLRDIERVLRRPIPRQEVDGFTAEQIPVPLPDPRALRAQRHAETNKPLGYRKGSPAQARAEGQRSRPQGDRPGGRPGGPRPERRDGQQSRPAGSGQVRTGSQGEVRNPGRWSRPEGAEGRSEGRSESQRPLTGRPFGGHVKPARPAAPRSGDNRGGAPRRPGTSRRRED